MVYCDPIDNGVTGRNWGVPEMVGLAPGDGGGVYTFPDDAGNVLVIVGLSEGVPGALPGGVTGEVSNIASRNVIR